jgi:hypothetical protein
MSRDAASRTLAPPAAGDPTWRVQGFVGLDPCDLIQGLHFRTNRKAENAYLAYSP